MPDRSIDAEPVAVGEVDEAELVDESRRCDAYEPDDQASEGDQSEPVAPVRETVAVTYEQPHEER